MEAFTPGMRRLLSHISAKCLPLTVFYMSLLKHKVAVSTSDNRGKSVSRSGPRSVIARQARGDAAGPRPGRAISQGMKVRVRPDEGNQRQTQTWDGLGDEARPGQKDLGKIFFFLSSSSLPNFS